MSLPTPSQSVSHRWIHQYMNHKKKLGLRCPLPTFGSFSFFQASLWLGVDKVLQKLTKSYKNKFKYLFQWCILIPRKCVHKTPFQHTVPPSLFPMFTFFCHQISRIFWPFTSIQITDVFYGRPLLRNVILLYRIWCRTTCSDRLGLAADLKNTF